MKYLIAIFYKYYNSGSTKTIAYENSLLVVLTLITFNILSVIIIFLGEISIFDDFAKHEENVFMIFFGYVILCFLLLRLLYPKRSIIDYISYHDSDNKGWLVVLYMVTTILLFVFLCVAR